jgi:hypothetical protein
MKLLHAPRGKPETRSFRIIKSAQEMGTRVATNESGAKVSQSFKTTRKSRQAKSHQSRRRNETYPRLNVSIMITMDIW